MTDERMQTQPATNPYVVAGVVLMATLSLFSCLFALSLIVGWCVNPPGSRFVSVFTGAYFSRERLILSAIIGAAGVIVFWGLVTFFARRRL